MIDLGTNTSDIEVRPSRDGARTLTMDANTQTSILIVDMILPSGGRDHLSIPQVNLSILGFGPDSLRNSHGRSPSRWAQEISIMPQFDGLASLPIRDPIGRRAQEESRLQDENNPKEAYMYKEPPYQGGNIQEKVVIMIMLAEGHIEIRPPERGRYPNQSGRQPDQGGYPDRGPPRRGYPNRNGRSPRRGRYPGEGPPDGGGPPYGDEGPPRDGGPPGHPGGQEPSGPQDLLDQ